MAVAVGMSGKYIRSFLLLTRKIYRNYFIARPLDGSARLANKSGWMKGDNLALYMEYFIKHTRHRKEQTCL
jgi:hypothetical protein